MPVATPGGVLAVFVETCGQDEVLAGREVQNDDLSVGAAGRHPLSVWGHGGGLNLVMPVELLNHPTGRQIPQAARVDAAGRKEGFAIATNRDRRHATDRGVCWIIPGMSVDGSPLFTGPPIPKADSPVRLTDDQRLAVR